MTDLARKVFEDALALSDDERAELAERLLASLPPDPELLAEIERRARRALADPEGGEPWEVAKQRILARIQRR